jgi:hypothetical protein
METLIWIILFLVFCIHYYQCKRWEQLTITLFEMEKKLGIRDNLGRKIEERNYDY